MHSLAIGSEFQNGSLGSTGTCNIKRATQTEFITTRTYVAGRYCRKSNAGKHLNIYARRILRRSSIRFPPTAVLARTRRYETMRSPTC